MGMTFNKGTFYPSDSKKKKTKKKTGTDADYHKNMSDKEMDEMGKLFKPIFSKYFILKFYHIIFMYNFRFT